MLGNSAPLHDRQAFERFYERTHLAVFRFIYGLQGGPPEEAEDLTAETYMRAWKARQRFSGDERAALGWALQIARNLVIDASRRRKVRLIVGGLEADWSEENTEQDIRDAAPGPEDLLSREQQVAILYRLLMTLPLEQREILLLRYQLDWPVKQIAGHLGLLENTVSVILRRTIQRIRQRWPEDEG